MEKIDYDRLAEHYDAHRRGGGPYLDQLVRLANQSRAQRVLELGAGTGNNSAAFAAQYPCALVGLELSSGMLERARAKVLPVHWVRGTALRLPIADSSVQFIFACYFLHHVDNLDTLFAECRRVLAGGYAAFVTAPTDFVDRHPMNAYFPSFAAIDKARFQDLDTIRASMTRAGFSQVSHETFTAEPRPVDHQYAERVKNKFISTYSLIPDDEFQAGIDRLYADLEPTGQLDIDVIWEALTIWAS